MSILSDNLKKARRAMEWSQEKAALQLGIKRSRLASYEEDRAEPSLQLLPILVEKYCILDWKGFLSNPHWDPFHQTPSPGIIPPAEKQYQALRAAIKSLAENC
jgi:transcriptional regulator with XRE-family HTH domain